MVLVVDSGSTKAEWCLVGDNNDERIKTQGLSPYFLNSAQIESSIRAELLPYLASAPLVTEVHFYGTGCSNDKNKAVVNDALKAVFINASTFVDHDLMAAAHSLSGKEEGIVCILGTGSNSCYFNGRTIERNSPGLGYVLGDEGSGAYLGKKLVQAYLYDRLDEDLKQQFKSRFQDTPADILEKVYRHPLANRYLASFTVFLSANRGNPRIESILHQGLKDFFTEHLTTYPQSTLVPVHFTGSIAWVFSDVIQSLCTSFNFRLGTIEKEPMNGLIRYYRD